MTRPCRHHRRHRRCPKLLIWPIILIFMVCWTQAFTTNHLWQRKSSRTSLLRLRPFTVHRSRRRWLTATTIKSKSKLLLEDEDWSPNTGRLDVIIERDDRSSQTNDTSSHGIVSPYEILYPEFVSAPATQREIRRRRLPLYSCLRVLRQALETIANGDVTALTNCTTTQIIRIEHVLSHSVDPLCWLQGQTKIQTIQQQTEHPLFYFATAEGTMETACYGSAVSHRGTMEDPDYWTLIGQLPTDTYLYGGQRFDVHSPMGVEWTEFSTGFWMVPAIELRRYQVDDASWKEEGPNKHGNNKKHHYDDGDDGENNNNKNRPFQATTTTTTNATTNSQGTTTTRKTVIAIHLYNSETTLKGFVRSARHILSILNGVSDATVAAAPPTTLPPVLSRESTYGPNLDGQEIYERGVTAALEEFERPDNTLEKVVLARRMDLRFGSYAQDVSALDILRKWKFASQPGGHLFYIYPGNNGGEFFGCTPERLFRIQGGVVLSEALAGTRPRGSTQQIDEELSRELFSSEKDQVENLITGSFIRNVFDRMVQRGWLQTNQRPDGATNTESITGGRFFVRRLRHLQHICQQFQGQLSHSRHYMDAVKFLLSNLHPTPAMGGYPKDSAVKFIRDHESVGFDRGFYSGPVGFVGRDKVEFVVGIRSGLLTRSAKKTLVSVYAGAGVVPGSTVQGEWAETSYKLAVVSSIFPQSPITLQSSPSPNVAWASAFIEELIRNGITQFYICPGSRSTPLVAAVARAVRSNVGLVHATSIHDERGAAFRALGYGRGANGPAAVITSSGTAIANLYPAIVEAGMDGVPLLILTADRPYENRDTGANQAIDQVKAFSPSYVRWFRDILPPDDDVPVAIALADAAHAVSLTRKLRGPVHLNIQFRENLAPDGGPIRNDDRVGSITKYDGFRFTDVPGFQRWSIGGGQWQKSYVATGDGDLLYMSQAIAEIGRLISTSRRGIIVVGNLRASTLESQIETTSQIAQSISNLAQTIGFPIFCGVQAACLRFDSSASVPFVEHLLRNKHVQENLKPDLILQFGAPLISSAIPNIIRATMSESMLHHVLVHPHHPHERADPEFTVTHKISTDITPFIKSLISRLENMNEAILHSELAPIIHLGNEVRSRIPEIVVESAREVMAKYPSSAQSHRAMTEPEVFLSISQTLSESQPLDLSLFLSNSMPIRDAEAFLYPTNQDAESYRKPFDVGVNRGASGIDGIISSAAGFADSTDRPTTLVIGDVAALHDINSLHAIRTGSKVAQAKRIHPLTTILLNNNGGGIFSFLPIAKHGSDVSFEEFFGTPTSSFSFEAGAAAFDIPFKKVSNSTSFREAYADALNSSEASLIEVEVAPREANVEVHQEITTRVGALVDTLLGVNSFEHKHALNLPARHYVQESLARSDAQGNDMSKTLVLLHGWMGDKSDWDEVGETLVHSISSDWSIVSIDLPGHGGSQLGYSSKIRAVRDALALSSDLDSSEEGTYSIDAMAKSVLAALKEKHGVRSIEGLAGYSLGGRVALAMRRICCLSNSNTTNLVTDNTKIALLGAYPGNISPIETGIEERRIRLAKDEKLSQELLALSNRKFAFPSSRAEDAIISASFLRRWYDAPLWGALRMRSSRYANMLDRRVAALSSRGRDIAAVLRQSTPSRCSQDDWRFVVPQNTLFIAGSQDSKYTSIGKTWRVLEPTLNYAEIPDAGHGLLVENPSEISDVLCRFFESDENEIDSQTEKVQGLVSSLITRQSRSLSFTGKSLDSSSKKEELPRRPRNAERGLEISTGLSGTVGALDIQFFTTNLIDDRRKDKSVFGIGWGENAKVSESNRQKQRSGFIIQLLSQDGLKVGLGEVSPLHGLHKESIQEAEEQLKQIAENLSDVDLEEIPAFDSDRILQLDGELGVYLEMLRRQVKVERLLPSVKSGLEMAILSLASQVVRLPIHQALYEYSPDRYKSLAPSATLPLNGLITRGSSILEVSSGKGRRIEYPSLKVKVGHQNLKEDILVVSEAFQICDSINTYGCAMVRADANRAFDDSAAIHFAASLDGIDVHATERIEYVEEPLRKQTIAVSGEWSLAQQVEALERWYKHTAIYYALDESISDLVQIRNFDWDAIVQDLKGAFPSPRGCAALVLKPSLLGLELSIRLARVARTELGIGAVVTSSFDSGIGLAYASFLASLSDATLCKKGSQSFPHGLSTFSMLAEDTISPSFGSYVTENGLLNVAPLSRAFYGLGLDEIRDSSISPPLPEPRLGLRELELTPSRKNQSLTSTAKDYEASTATSSSGREISVVVSLPLPFSADIACARFTDLPQQPRWSPWLSSVTYLDAGKETEWTLNVRGMIFRWRATSTLLEVPYKGIQWESVSGLKNTGIVEFIPTSETTCLLKVRMAIITPRILSTLFKGTSVFFEDFLRNKLLKWSLEMFRDVVKGDLALEEGDVELGDALFSAVEGKACAIEATLSFPMESGEGDPRDGGLK